jgi:hypothetical protein
MPAPLPLDALVSTVIRTLTERQLKRITHGVKDERGRLIAFTNLVYTTVISLEHHPLIGTNPTLTCDDHVAFARRLTLYVYDRSLILIHYDFSALWKQEWKAINQRQRHRMKQAKIDDGFVGGTGWQQSMDQKKTETQALHDRLIAETQTWFAPRIAQLMRMTIQNPNPWEQAFFVGLFGHERSRWYQLLDPARSVYAYALDSHTVTWAFLGRDGQNAAVTIVASRDSLDSTLHAAESWCRSHGWTFFGFTYADVATNLGACVAQVDAGIAWHLSPY